MESFGHDFICVKEYASMHEYICKTCGCKCFTYSNEEKDGFAFENHERFWIYGQYFGAPGVLILNITCDNFIIKSILE